MGIDILHGESSSMDAVAFSDSGSERSAQLS
jgi:hypothetical protein